MQGRYGQTGADRLNRFILIVALVWFILSRVGVTRSAIPAVLLVAWSYYRMFSRNIPKRYQENIAYCRIADSVKARIGIRGGNVQSDLGRRFQQWKARMQDRTTHHIYRCPSCGQRIRVPRGKGRIEIRCPKCNAAFIKRS